MRMRGSLYWLFVVLLLAFGLVGILSIGAPFLLLGVTLAVLAPYRNRPRVFWPWVAGVLGFVAGYILVAPLGCAEVPTISGRGGSVTCSSVLRLPYRGAAPYEPPHWPALLAAVAVALVVAAATRLALKDRTSSKRLSGQATNAEND